MKLSLRFIRIITLLLFVTTSFVPGYSIPRAQAAALLQPSNPTWSTPVNLSKSGGTDQPAIFTDSSGTVHALWKDMYASFVYSKSQDGTTWDVPVPLALPFYDFNYQIIPSSNGRIHVIWVKEERAIKQLMISSVDADKFGDPASWAGPYLIYTDVFWFNAVEGADKGLHLLFLKVSNTEGAPAGIYYVKSSPGAEAWSSASLVYASQYFRNLQGDERLQSAQETSNAPARIQLDIESIAYNDQYYLLATWDNPASKRVFFSRSLDNGTTWEEPTIVDGPGAKTPYLSSEKIHIHLSSKAILRTWNAIESGGLCTHKYQYSKDGGKTWSQAEPIIAGATSCADTLQVFDIPTKDAVLAFAVIQSKLFLMAWNGQQWSVPEEQTEVSNFVDTENFNSVQFACQQATISGDQLLMIGCDAGSGGDIWQTSYTLTDQINQWFTRLKEWSIPVHLPVNNSFINNLAMVNDAASTIHLMWSQPETENPSSNIVLQTNIFYASWDSKSQPMGPYTVFNKVEGIANQFSLIYDQPTERLLTTWAGGQSGEIKFSWSKADQANSVSGWSPVTLIDKTNPLAREPVLQADSNGFLYTIYATPFNEHRGIYLVRSQDGGNQWSEPVQVYNAATEECEMAKNPSLAIVSTGYLSALWICSTSPGGIGPLSLLTSSSSDDGQTWSPAEEVISGSVIWAQLVSTPSKVHRFWQISKTGKYSIWHSVSEDGGLTWQTPKNIYSSSVMSLFTSVVSDTGEQMHLTHITQENSEAPRVDYILWDGSKWIPEDSLLLSISNLNNITALNSVISPEGYLIVAIANFVQDETGDLVTNQISLANMPITLSASEPAASVTPQIQPTHTAATDPTLETTQETVPTATQESAVAPLQEKPARSNSSSGIILAVIASALTISIVVGVRLGIGRPKQF